MDILMRNGDIYINGQGELAMADSVAQKIRIRLLWLAGEWRWDKEEGLPYKESLFIKNPDLDLFESLVREKIFEVPEVTEVRDVNIEMDGRARTAKITFVAYTDREKIDEEVVLNA